MKESGKKMIEIGKNIVVSGAVAGAKTLAEKNYFTSWIKRWFEEYGNISGEKRAEKVEKEFERRLTELEQSLGKENFLACQNLASIVVSTYQGAISDIEENKIAFYANAAINAIKNENINDAKKHIFLNMLRDFSSLHIEILYKLRIIQEKWEAPVNQNRLGYVVEYFKKNFESIAKADGFEYVLLDLEKRNCCFITEGISWDDTNSDTDKLLTKIASEFLDFIAEQENTDTKI